MSGRLVVDLSRLPNGQRGTAARATRGALTTSLAAKPLFIAWHFGRIEVDGGPAWRWKVPSPGAVVAAREVRPIVSPFTEDEIQRAELAAVVAVEAMKAGKRDGPAGDGLRCLLGAVHVADDSEVREDGR